jgi:hypothetical protein
LPVSSRTVFLGAFALGLACLSPRLAPAGQQPGPSVVRLVKTDAGYQLVRNGEPYFIKGGGGERELKALATAGGNSVRTWGADNLGPLLDDAQRLGLTVTVGIWLGHERHGFDYNNADQVSRQYEEARRAILRYKGHPAVLMWGIGNEMEGPEKADHAAVWSAVNNIASLAKKLDPNHPTMTVLAEIAGDRVKNVHRLCPDVDIVGINSYGGAASIPERYRQAGGVKPYVLTEYGPPGAWETKPNDWGAVPELTSTEKAERYREVYEKAIVGGKGLCLGGYAFTWGHKQEATATWFGLFLPDGSRLGGADVLTELWSGKPPANRCPAIKSLKLAGADQVDPGATVRATLEASDPEGDPLRVKWVLSAETETHGEGGDAEPAPPTYPDAIIRADGNQAEVRMPRAGGTYRLFAYVHDDHGGAAVANVPLRVKGPVVVPNGKRAPLPLVVYDEADRERPPYTPSGWMGNDKAVKLDERCETNPHAGKTCIRVEYAARDGWAGVVWQHPEGDWGDRPGGWDLTGAKRLTFWARGDQGGEVVSFELGLLGKDKHFPDTAHGKLADVKLTREWQQYSIDLAGKDLTRIKTGFSWVLAAGGRPVTFYLDDIRFE